MGIQKNPLSLSAAEGFKKAAAQQARWRHEHEPRHRDAMWGPEDGTGFLLGVWTKCRSSFWKAARYLADDEILEVEFDNKGKAPSYGAYHGVPFAVAEQFAHAPSKGGFMHDVLIPGGYSFTRYF